MVRHGIEELSYLDDSNAVKTRGDYRLTLKTDSGAFIYQKNEEISFMILADRLGVPLESGHLTYELLWDKSTLMEKGEIKIVNGKAAIRTKADKPGFIVVKCWLLIEQEEPLLHSCGVAINPELIEPSLEAPDDFDAFWDEQKKELAKVPLESTWRKIDHESHPHLQEYSHKDLLSFDISKVEIFDVKLSFIEKAVTGIYTRPKNASPKKHPAMLCVQGAGVMPTRPHNFLKQAEKGILVYEMGVHGISNLEEESYYQNLINGELKGYTHFGRENQYTSYFRLVFLRVKRGLEFLMSQPEWDGKTIVIRGSSQGGAQCLAGAYLEPLVSMISVRVPSLCDHTGFLKDRSVGGGKLVAFDASGQPDAATLNSSRYFDGVNFAGKLSCVGNFSVGLIDGTCSPSSVYAAYNHFKGKKQMHVQPYTAHACTPQVLAIMEDDLDSFVLTR